MKDSRLRAEKVRLGYTDVDIVHDVDLVIPTGEITIIVGPNACGKSTLLRGLSRLLAPKGGAVYLDGELISTLKTKDVAQRLGVLPQTPVAPEGLSVYDLVSRGRSPHQTWWRQWDSGDETAVLDALAATGMTEHATQPIDELSGGQRQRAWIAMALAQQTELLLLDEPTNHLDVTHQLEVLDLVVDLRRDQGRTIVVVIHDLNLACRYADHLVVMKHGRIVTEGRPADVVTAELITSVFDVQCQVIPDPVSQTPLVLPFGRHHRTTPHDTTHSIGASLT